MKTPALESFTTFGDLLRYLRQRQQLTQRDLGLAVGYGDAQITRLERNTRLPDVSLVAAQFIPALHLEDEPEVATRLIELAAQARGEPTPESLTFVRSTQSSVVEKIGAPLHERRDNPERAFSLPAQVTSFIGREREMAEVRRLLEAHRLVTLTGSGGVGKTRLAIEVAAEMLADDDFPDGVWLVELASLADPALVPQAVANALHLIEKPDHPHIELLIAHLRDKRALLALDNCEHLIGASAELTDGLLRACPQLHVLATSREALRISGEHAWRVPSLATPDPASLPPLEQARDYAAVQLFVAQAGAVQPDFDLNAGNMTLVARICHRLDGIPLAIEMAAAQVSALSVEEIAVGLDDRFTLLTSGSRTALLRHQTLRAALDWSYDLLSPAEQALLARLSVFAGGWTAEAAKAVCADQSEPGNKNQEARESGILSLVLELVYKSLVVAEQPDGRTRYRMLETIRAYALDRLRETDEENALCDRHLAFFMQLAERPWPTPAHERADWLNRLEREQANFRAAIDWALASRDSTMALRLVWALSGFWDRRKQYHEAREQMRKVLAASGDVRTLERARVLTWISSPSFSKRFREAGPLLEEAVAIAQELGDKRLAAHALRAVGFNAHHRRDLTLKRACHEQGLEIWRELGDKAGICSATWCLGFALIDAGDYRRAEAILNEGLSLCEEVGAETDRLDHVYAFGEIAFYRGEYVRAKALFAEGLRASMAAEEAIDIHWYQEAFAILAVAEGQFIRAARLMGARDAIMESRGTPLDTLPWYEYEGVSAAVREQLNEETFSATYAEGRAMTLEQAIEDALSDKPNE